MHFLVPILATPDHSGQNSAGLLACCLHALLCGLGPQSGGGIESRKEFFSFPQFTSIFSTLFFQGGHLVPGPYFSMIFHVFMRNRQFSKKKMLCVRKFGFLIGK